MNELSSLARTPIHVLPGIRGRPESSFFVFAFEIRSLFFMSRVRFSFVPVHVTDGNHANPGTEPPVLYGVGFIPVEAGATFPEGDAIAMRK
jgi:hypothetical protein